MQSATPLMRQYFQIKAEYADVLLLFQVGDFYELFYDDAKTVSALLGITLTARGRNNGESIPLCGVPVHAIGHYLPKLVKAGFSVAMCQQLEEPKPGTIVRRGVTHVLTPGTLTDSGLLDAYAPSYLLVCAPTEYAVGMLFAELLTAQLFATVVHTNALRIVETELARFMPDEIIVTSSTDQSVLRIQEFIATLGHRITSFSCDEIMAQQSQEWIAQRFDAICQEKITHASPVRTSLTALYGYLHKNQERALANFNGVKFYNPDEYMVIDAATQRNLELIHNMADGTKTNTLAALLDESATAMGSRTIRKWLVRPLLDHAMIVERQETVAFLCSQPQLMHALTYTLAEIGDLERVVGRVGLQRASIHDYCALRTALQLFPQLLLVLQTVQTTIAYQVSTTIGNFDVLTQLLVTALVDDPTDTQLIKKGFDHAFDEIQALAQEGHASITALERDEQQRTGINSLKIRYNQVHGYYIEITKANLGAVPADYIRHQTLVGKERFTNTRLKHIETEIVQARLRVEQMEREIFNTITAQVLEYVPRLRRATNALAQFDALLGLARLAHERNYVRPVISNAQEIVITQGKHPVVDERLKHRFIANDTMLSDSQRMLIITGPNMGGKSTYLRQVALIQIMAQCGSFVPAVSAQVPIIDRIFTRIGAGDDVAQGKSTFLVEMEETSLICTAATHRSLVILDEVGRGTSTFDGIAIAQAIVEYLYREVRPFCLFATHYQELTTLAQHYPGISNFYASSKRTQSGILLLYKIVPGIADGSFGIDVARLAQLPACVIERAHEIVSQLITDKKQAPASFVPACMDTQQCFAMHNGDNHLQIQKAKQIVKRLKNMQLESLSPRAVYDLIWDLQQEL